MPRTRVLVVVDGAFQRKRGGWGVVIVAHGQEWRASGRCAARSSDEAEFTAAVQGLRISESLALLRPDIRVRLVSDSRRLIDACRDRKVRVYSETDLERIAQRQHVLSDSCLVAREEIVRFGLNVDLRFWWIKRASTIEQQRADQLAKLALNKKSDTVSDAFDHSICLVDRSPVTRPEGV